MENTNTKKWGGSRAGAGRRGISDGSERKPRSIYCSAVELIYIKRLLQVVRSIDKDDGINRFDCTIGDIVWEDRVQKYF